MWKLWWFESDTIFKNLIKYEISESNHSFTQRKGNNYYKLIWTEHSLVKSTIMMLIWNLAAAVNVLDSVGIHKVTIRSNWDLTPPPPPPGWDAAKWYITHLTTSLPSPNTNTYIIFNNYPLLWLPVIIHH